MNNLGSIMECGGKVAAYVEGAFSGFVGWPMPNMDHEDMWMDMGDYSPENVAKVAMVSTCI